MNRIFINSQSYELINEYPTMAPSTEKIDLIYEDESNESIYDILSNNKTLVKELITIFYDTSKWFNVILISLITLFGLYGNLVSIQIFLSKAYTNVRPLKYYLIILSTSDLFVLVFHYIDFTFRSWVNLLGIYSTKFNFVDKSSLCCKIIPYFRNVFRTISVYALLIMTLQRFILLYFPLVRSKLNSVNFNKKLIMVLIIFGLALNLNNLLMNKLVKHEKNGQLYCNFDQKYTELHFFTDLLFVFLTILIPSIIVLVFSVILLEKIKTNASKNDLFFNFCTSCTTKLHGTNHVGSSLNLSDGNNKILNQKTEEILLETSFKKSSSSLKNIPYPNIFSSKSITIDKTKSESCLDKSLNEFKKAKSQACSHQNITLDQRLPKMTGTRQNGKIENRFEFDKKSGHSIRTTYILVLLSKWFILLHLPYFICWCVFHVHMNQIYVAQNSDLAVFVNEQDNRLDVISKTMLLKAFVNIFEILFLFNYSINFLLYLINGPVFRKRFKEVVCGYWKKN